MPVITVLSDWNSSNSYYGQLAGKLYSSGKDFELIELSKVTDHNVADAAYLLNSYLPNYPTNTIHLVFVGMTTDPSQIVIGRYKGQYIITWLETGLLSLLDDIDDEKRLFSYSNEGVNWIDGIGQCCIKLLSDKNLNNWTEPVSETVELNQIEPAIQRNTILANVIHIDTYGNAISNISKQLFDEIGKGRQLEIYLQSNFNKITSLSTHYEPKQMGELIALFNERDLLEIAISNGNLAELLSVSVGSEIIVKFISQSNANFFG